MSAHGKVPWDMIGAILTVIVIVLYCIAEFALPALRRWRLKKPCKVSFLVRSMQPVQLSYVIQDDKDHHVKELVLPSHSSVEIELAYKAKMNFHESEFIFGCDGDDNLKPYAEECFFHFIKTGKNRLVPNVDDGHYIDIHNFYHAPRNKMRCVGTHFVIGFKLLTRAPGRYKASISFLTNEIEGNSELHILVEDKPRTRMKCEDHHGCTIKPYVSTP